MSANKPYIIIVIANKFKTVGSSFQNATIVSLISESASYFSSMNTKILKILKESKDCKLAFSISPGIIERISIIITNM